MGIVIVIVGILSAVALPNFLNQTTKARATEAKSTIATAFKNAQVEYHEKGQLGSGGSTTYSCDGSFGLPTTGVTEWEYTCNAAANVVTIEGTNENAGLKFEASTLDATTGQVSMGEGVNS